MMSENLTETQPERDPGSGRFLAGNSGNGGRKPGSRNKLGEAFIADVYQEWQKTGASALKRMSQDDPSGFVRVVAGILPKELDATLSIDVDLFAEVSSFAQAYRLALQHIGADQQLIEAEGELIEVEADE